MKKIIKLLKKDTNNLENIIYRKKYIGLTKIFIIYNETLVSSDKVSDFIIRSLDNITPFFVYHKIINNIDNFKYKVLRNYNEIDFYLNSGFTILLIGKHYIALETKKDITRSITSPNTENVIRGPSDAFTENIEINIGLIKRRIKNNNLWIKNYNIGLYTKTNISLIYINTIVKEELINMIDDRLNKINIDGILSSGIIKNLIEKENKSIFPIIMSTERPYMTCKYLLNGNAVILVDNDPFALILPISLNDFFFSEEDEYSGSINTSFSRIIRYICFIISLVTPALYIAMTTYNQEIIPTPLLLSIAGQRENVPFSAFIEAILMIFSFDILRESDLKMPNFANSSLSIVGALILGDAAVSAGIVSPIMIIVVAITSISSLAFSEPELINSLRWYRLIFMLGASFFGIYGIVLVGLYFLITIISTKSFTLPYLSPFAPINLSQLKDSIIYYPIKKRKKRNNYLSNNIVKNKTEE
jgi:hypothetical protein